MTKPKALVLLSGGMDSVTLAYFANKQYDVRLALSFNYGQRHKKELDFAKEHATRLGAEHRIVDLSHLCDLFKGSSLTQDDILVPDGHYAEETMKATVVPNRNAMMLSIAYAAGISGGYSALFTAVHAGDHFIYPDCRPEFISTLDAALEMGNAGFNAQGLKIMAPFVHMTKAQIAQEADKLGVPLEWTWSCYKGEALHCGTCGTCHERQEALWMAGVQDKTIYQSPLEQFLFSSKGA
jgi:7-cyano-7-deazaguanine synthase